MGSDASHARRRRRRQRTRPVIHMSDPTQEQQNDPLDRSIELPESQEVEPPGDDPLGRVLLRVMETDPESNIVFGNIPRGEAEEFAAAVTYAEFSGSPVILRYENMKNMAKRAEAGSLLEKILATVKAIGKSVGEPRSGFFSKFKP